MYRDLAAATFCECREVQQKINRPLESGIPDLTPEERDALKWSVGGAMAAIAGDLMLPLVFTFPELDPDPHGPPSSEPHEPIEVEPPSVGEFGRMLVRAADEAAIHLHNIVDTFERGSDPEEARAFKAQAASSFQNIAAMGDLGRRLLARSI